MQPSNCVPRETLKEYLAGWTDASRSEQIEYHLSNCPACEDTIAVLEAEPDTLAVMIQSTAAAEADESGTMLSALVKASNLVAPSLGKTEAPIESNYFVKTQGQIGPYLLLSSLGSGGMGSVFLARHQQLGKHVAIKLLPTRLSRRDHFEARFQREIRAAGGLDHPAIVSSTDAGEDQGTHYLVMEYIDGLDLSQISRACGKLEIADACELVRQVALGLSHAHAVGIVHRDIKPSNLMLNRRGQAKILDFGLARLGPWSEFSAELTTVGQLMGTLDYMAPEQAEHAEAVDYRADIYSLGATLFRLLCGRAPLAASPDQSPLAKLRLLATQDPPRLSTLRIDAPEALVELVREMLARNPSDRPASAAHVAERLDSFCKGNQLAELIERAIAARAAEPQEMQDANSEMVGTRQLSARLSAGDLTSPEAHASTSIALKRASRGNLTRWLAIGLASTLFAGVIYSGVVIWLEGQQGWLHIESEAQVTVDLVSEAKAVKKWKVEPGENSTRLYAGKYRIVLEEGSDSVEIDNEQLQVLKGGLVIAKIVKSKPDSAALSTGSTPTTRANAIPPASTAELVPGDALTMEAISFLSLKHRFLVQADSTVKLPLIGTISIQGMTVDSLDQQCERLYKPHMKEPSIDILRDYSVGPSARSNFVPPASTANLSPGDGLLLIIRGYDNAETKFVVQADSTVKLPLVGTFSVAGLTVDDFEKKANELYKQFFKEPGIEVFRDISSLATVGSLAMGVATNAPPSEFARSGQFENDESSTANATLYNGRPLSEWMKILPLERSTDGVAEALVALQASLTKESKPQIAALLMKELPKANWHQQLVKRAFVVLKNANPQGYAQYLVRELDESEDEAWKSLIAKCGLVSLPADEMGPLHNWLQQQVFSRPSPLLHDVASFYLTEALRDNAPSFWMKTLDDSNQLDDMFWLKNLEHPELNKNEEKFWSAIIPRAISSLADPDADAQRIVYACAAIDACPKEYRGKLIDSKAERFAEIWEFRSKQMTESDSLRRSVVSVPRFSILGRPTSSATKVRLFELKRPWSSNSINVDSLSTTPLYALTSSLKPEGPTSEELSKKLIPGAAIELFDVWDFDPWKVKLDDRPGNSNPTLTFSALAYRFSGFRSDVQKANLADLLTLQQLYAVSQDGGGLSPVAQQFIKECQHVFAKKFVSDLDRDSDGKLSPAEAEKFGVSQFAKADQDQDQFLTADEYIGYRELHQVDQPPKVEVSSTQEFDLLWATKRIAMYDKDGDKKLSSAEIERMLVKPAKEVDSNSDGFIDAQEYAKHRPK